MTLDDLLALLPDNNTGAIDAADLRTIVTELWNDGADLTVRVAALEAGSGGGGIVQVTGRWQVNPDSGADPQSMQITADEATWSAASELRFGKIDQHNTDMTTALMNAQDLYGQMQADATTWARFTVSGTPVDEGSFVRVPVTYVNGEGSIATAQWQAAVVVLTRAAA